MTTPDSPPLVVHPDDLARRLRIPLPLDGDVEWDLRQAIADVQADVVAHLGRSITPETRVATGVWASAGGWHLPDTEPVLSIVTAVPEADAWGHLTGRFTVTYTCGLDARTEAKYAPIRRYVMAWATVHDAVGAHVPSSRREITSVSVEGQSVTFKPVGGVDPATIPVEQRLPQLSSLDRWRIAGRRVFQRRGY